VDSEKPSMFKPLIGTEDVAVSSFVRKGLNRYIDPIARCHETVHFSFVTQSDA
jgi:hypothetical protein